MAPTTTTVKVKKSVLDMIKWINDEGSLTSELRLSAVARPLAALDESTALEVLNGLLEQEEVIDDPTVWIVEAAKALAEAEAEEAPAAAAALAGSTAPKVKLPASTVKLVGELNASGTLQVELSLPDIVAYLALLSSESQAQVLRGLEQRAAEVTNPTAWLQTACSRKAGKGKGKGGGKGKGNGAAKGTAKGEETQSSAAPLTASERKILRTINFINKTMGLEQPVNFGHLKSFLVLVDEKTQLAVLNKLKEKLEEGQEIANPTTWVKRGLQRSHERYEQMVKEKQTQKRKAQEQWEEPEEPKPKAKKKAAAAGKEQEVWGDAAAGDEEWDEWAE